MNNDLKFAIKTSIEYSVDWMWVVTVTILILGLIFRALHVSFIDGKFIFWFLIGNLVFTLLISVVTCLQVALSTKKIQSPGEIISKLFFKD